MKEGNSIGYRKYNEYHKIIEGKEYKQCQDCNEWFEMNSTNFNTVNGNKDKFNHRCKTCQEIYQKEYYALTREKQIKDATRWTNEHKEWRLEYDRERYKNNPEYFIENNRKNVMLKPEIHKPNKKRWRKEHPERVRYLSSLHRDHDVSTKEYQDMLKVFGYQCAYCGMTSEEHKKKYNEKLHNDHVDEDGYNDLRNDVPACKGCNCSKHESTLEEWYSKQKFFL